MWASVAPWLVSGVAVVLAAVAWRRAAIEKHRAESRAKLPPVSVETPHAPMMAATPQSAEELFSAVQSPLLVLDPDGRILRFNPACEAVSGYRAEEVLGRCPWEVLWPEAARDGAGPDFARIVRDGGPVRRELTWLTRGGEERRIAWLLWPRRDAAGEVFEIIASGIDVTARKAAERALRRAQDEMEKRVVLRTAALRAANDALALSEARLAEAQRIAQIGNWDWDVPHGLLHWSDEVFRIFGLEPMAVEPTIERLLALTYPGDRAALRQAQEDALARRIPYSIDHRLVRPDGEVRVVHQEGVVSYDRNGSALRMTGTLQDITERKRAEESLAQARDELERRVTERTAELHRANQALRFTQFTVDHAGDAIFWIGTGLDIVYVNEAACRVLGYAREQLLSGGLALVNSGWAGGQCRERLAEAREKGGLTFESMFLRSDGSELPVEIAANFVEYEGQTHLCLFARDITERLRAERRHLEQLDAERVLSAISSRFVAVEDVDGAVHDALADLRGLLGASCGHLLRVTKEDLFLEWQEGCDYVGCGNAENERLYAHLPSLRAAEVVVAPEENGNALVLVPLCAEQVLVGIMVFKQARNAERWREGDFALLRVAARVITSGMERWRAELQTMQLLDENRRLARESLEIQERERAHLARELHDELGQCLTAIRADAQSICRLSREREPRIYESGQAITEVASRVYEVVRNIMRRLRPEVLDELGLGPAVRETVRQWRQRHPEVEWELELDAGAAALPEAIQITAYRVVQECITNVVKHAGAGRVLISVRVQGELLRVVVEDNGHGRAPGGQRGLGLLGMRERVLAVGGGFQVDNRPGRGYRVEAVFPLHERGERANAV